MANYDAFGPDVVPDEASSQRAPIGTGTPALINIVTAAGLVELDDPLVFRVTSVATISTITATLTDDLGAHTAYNNGFVGGYSGSDAGITDGSEITIDAPGGGWDPGSLVLSVTAS